MSAPARKLRTKEITIRGGKERPRLFVVPQSKVQSVVELLSKFEVHNASLEEDKETVPWRVVLKDIIEKYTEAGATLQGARLKAEMSQVELAKRLGVTQADVSNMEHGRRSIGKKMAKRLAKILKTNYRIFL